MNLIQSFVRILIVANTIILCGYRLVIQFLEPEYPLISFLPRLKAAMGIQENAVYFAVKTESEAIEIRSVDKNVNLPLKNLFILNEDKKQKH